MRCPACKNELTQVQVNSVELDACKGGCGGTWFDPGELAKFDDMSEFSPDTLLRVEKNAQVVVDRAQTRQCPRCVNSPLVEHYYDSQGAIEVDECLQCGGLWLDLSELKQIREQRDVEENRARVLQAYAYRVEGAGKNPALVKRVQAVFQLIFK